MIVTDYNPLIVIKYLPCVFTDMKTLINWKFVEKVGYSCSPNIPPYRMLTNTKRKKNVSNVGNSSRHHFNHWSKWISLAE